MPEPSAGKPEPETSPFQAASSCGCGDAWTSGTHESKPEQAGQEAAPEASVPERTHSAYMSDLEAGPLLSEAEDCDCSDAQCRASNDSEHSAMAVAEPASPPVCCCCCCCCCSCLRAQYAQRTCSLSAWACARV